MNLPADAQYERMQSRLARRAARLSLVCMLMGAGALFVVSGGGGSGGGLAARVSNPVPVEPGVADGCTSVDLAKPAMAAMPVPRVVTSTVTIRPGPDVERLTPPDGRPSVTAGQAWLLLHRHRDVAPSSDGSAEVLLGDLYAATPAVVEPGRPAAVPVFTHRLVWAIYGRHQPEVPAAGADPPCYFESTVFYVDALTGSPLVAEVFPPPAGAPTDI